MKIACVGGGPAGLYFAISMKLRDPAHEIEIFERNAPGVTFGWGVVFSDQTVENHARATTRHPRKPSPTSSRTGTISTSTFAAKPSPPAVTASSASAASACSKSCRTARASWASILHFERRVRSGRREVARLRSRHRVGRRQLALPRCARRKRSAVDVDVRANKFVWLGTSKVFDAFTFAFEETEHGWIWAHAYRFAPDCSTFIVECSEETWRDFGFDRMSQDESIAACEQLFAKYLDGHSLQSNASHLVGSRGLAQLPPHQVRALVAAATSSCSATPRTPRISRSAAAPSSRSRMRSSWPMCCRAPHPSLRGAEGDAATMAMRCWLRRKGSCLEAALDEYQAERNLEVLKLQNSARNSTEWFETLDRYIHFEPLQFAYSLLTRSQRISHENLRLRDREWLEGVERWFWKRATDGKSNKTAPPMFAPLKLREMEVSNRVTVSPMAMYSAVDGVPNDFHFVHYGERAHRRRGAAVHRDDLRLARRPDQPRLHRHVERRSRRGVEAHRRFRPRAIEGEDLPPARPFGRQGFDPPRLGRQRRSARRRQLAGDVGERRPLVAGQPGAHAR